MVVYKPQNKSNKMNGCHCKPSHNYYGEPMVEEEGFGGNCPCPPFPPVPPCPPIPPFPPHPPVPPHPEPHPCEPIITITTDEAPVLETDILYGPPGKDGKINGYNQVTIEGGNNIEVVTNKNRISINSITYEANSEDSNENNIFNYIDGVKPRSEWIIKHNLNKYPSVTVVDEDGTEIICEVQYISKNEVHLLFNGRFRGIAYLN